MFICSHSQFLYFFLFFFLDTDPIVLIGTIFKGVYIPYSSVLLILKSVQKKIWRLDADRMVIMRLCPWSGMQEAWESVGSTGYS